MRHFMMIALAALAVNSCESMKARYGHEWEQEDASNAAPEAQGMNSVDIRRNWTLRGNVLDVQRDSSGKQILVASAQEGASLDSIRPPLSTRVITRATADAIYYDAFHDLYELAGSPVIYQGSYATHPVGSTNRLWIHNDGTVRTQRPGDLPDKKSSAEVASAAH